MTKAFRCISLCVAILILATQARETFLLRRLTKIFGASFVVLALGKVVTLLAHAVMARSISTNAFGQVSLAVNWGILLATLFSFGFQTAGTRIVTTYLHEKAWGRLRAFMLFGAAVLAGSSALVALICGGWVAIMGEQRTLVLILIAAMFPAMLSSFVRGGFMRGLGDVVGSLAPYELFGPGIAILILWALPAHDGLSAGLMFALGLTIAEAIGFVWLGRMLPPSLHRAVSNPDYPAWFALSGSVHLTLVARLAIQRLDLILVGMFLDLQSAALYAAAQRLALSVAFVGRVTSHVMSPRFALAFKVSPERVRHEVRDAGIFSAVVGLPAFFLMSVASPYLLGMFGSEFQSAWPLLILLSFGQLTNALLSPVNQALLMTNFERFQLKLTVATCIGTMVAYFTMIPAMGNLGAALASTGSLLVVNGAAFLLGYAKLKREIAIAA